MNSDVSLKKCDELDFPAKYTDRVGRRDWRDEELSD